VTTPVPPPSSSGQSAARPGRLPILRRTALVEIAVFFAVSLAVDHWWGQADRFGGVEPHPFWIIVLLMAVQYGTREALVASAAAAVALLAGHLPVQSFDQDVHQYVIQVLMRPLLWMIAAVVLGELRGRHRQLQVETAERLRNAERQIELLSRAHTELTETRTRLETRLAGQLRTAAGVLDAGRRVDALDPGQVLAGATELLRTALNAKASSLFLLSGDGLTLAAAEGWGDLHARQDRYANTTPLFQEIVGAQRFISIASPEGERVLRADGLMAGPLIDPTSGTLFGMLKVEEMSFIDFNLSSLQTFKSVCTWIAAAYGKALAHKRSQIEDESTHLYSMTYLDRQIAYLTHMARRFRFDLAVLQVQIPPDELTVDVREALPVKLGTIAQELLRGTDLLFSHQPASLQFVVLLPGATAEGAAVVADKLVDALQAAFGALPCTTQVRTLFSIKDAGGTLERRPSKEGQVA
jgi:hypothetical protein